MLELSDRNYLMLSDALKTCGGNADDIIDYCMEDFYVHEYEILTKFIKWCESEDRWFGRANYQQVFQEFLNVDAIKRGNQ